MKKIFGVFIFILFFLVSAKSAEAADWPSFRGNQEHSGVSSETISIPLEKKWDYPMGGSSYSSPVVADGKVFVGSSDGKVYAVSVGSPALVWSYQTGEAIEATPLYNNGTIYVGSTDGYLYALNAVSGDFIWSFDAGQGGGQNPVSSSPVTDGTNVYFASQSGRIFALNATTGAWVWQYDVPGGFSYPSAALILSKQYNALFIGSEDGTVYAINTTGTTKWTYATGVEPGENRFSVSSPAVVGGVVYIGSDNGVVYAINAGTGSLSWSYTVPGLPNDILSSPAVTDSTVYVGSINGNFYALGTSGGNKGKLLWSYKIGNEIKSSPVVAGNLVFIGSQNLFFALNATNGDFKWSYGIGQQVSSPAISNGVIYLASDRLYALENTTALVAMVEKWKYNTGTSINYSGLAVDSGVTYAGADDGSLYALDSSGILKWKYTTNGGPVSSKPVVSQGTVFFGTKDSKTFYAVNTADGTLKWSKVIGTNYGYFVSSTPVVSGSVIYVGAHDGTLYAWDISNGNEVWKYTITAPYHPNGTYNLSSPIVDAGKVYFSYGNSALVALDQTNGIKVWEYSFGGFNSSDFPTYILLSNNTIYAGGIGKVYALNLDGTRKWSTPTNGTVESGFVVFNGTLIGGTYGHIYGLNASTGAINWQYQVQGGPGEPFLWEDMVFIMTGGYRVYVLNAENGQLRFEYAGNFSPLTPVVTGGILYLGARDGRIYAEDIDNYVMPVKASLGGTIMTVYGDRLQIPPAALAADTTITLSIAPNDQGGGGIVSLPRKYRFGPDGTSFFTPTTAKFAYKTSDLQGADPNTVKVYVWDSTTSTWTVSGGLADTVNKTIDVNLSRFSDYALFGRIAPELNFPVLLDNYIYGTPIIVRYSAFDPDTITNVQGFLNGQPIATGSQVNLIKLGKNTFKVTATKTGGEEITQSVEFEVVYSLEWFSPLTTQTTTYGETLPIKFKTTDYKGGFTGDESVKVEVADGKGGTTGEFTIAKSNVYIKMSESHYLINLSTKSYSWITPGGTYQIKVSFNGISYPPYEFTIQ